MTIPSAAVVPLPDFVMRDLATIVQECVAKFELESGRKLQPAHVERLLVDLVAYREKLVRETMQFVGEQSLVAFARYPMLDYLGEIVGVVRLEAIQASATIRYTLVGVQGAPVNVPAGTRVQTADGVFAFATTELLTIAAGALYGDVLAKATPAGAKGNGYVAGQISVILDPVALVATAVNTTTSANGADREDDDRLRARMKQAPGQFSVAGSVEAYRYHALTVSAAIIDVSVTSPTAGEVKLYVLATTGLPSAQLLADVAAKVTGQKVRPLTDNVTVVAPTAVPYQITATLKLLAGADVVATMAAAQKAAEAYAADRRAGIGRDIVPSQVVTALSVPGVYEVTLALPAYRDVLAHEWANCTLITLTQGGTVSG